MFSDHKETLSLLPEAIQKVVIEFQHNNADYGTIDGAEGNCFIASVDFQEAIENAGLLEETERGKTWDVIRVWCLYNGRAVTNYCLEHWCFRWNDIGIDWTARQFNSKAPFPAVYQIKEGEWDSGESRKSLLHEIENSDSLP